MQSKGFAIDTLVNTNATASNIRQALETLTKASKLNDTIYIHFSGHGQPFEDINGDEQDGWDEAFVPIDAQMYYHAGIYEGEKHITDDELNVAFNRIRERIGTRGMVFVVIDACHSGTMSRDNEAPINDDAATPGTWGLSATYFDQPYNAVIAPTTDAKTFMDEGGYKGYGLTANYGLAKNMVLELLYFDTEAKKGNSDEKIFYADLYLTF